MQLTQSHPFFKNLLTHSDDALAEKLDIAIRERKTVHEWPLSVVQKLTLQDGRQFAYKSQLPPTVEPQFYAAASSSLLTNTQSLVKLGDCAIMIFDWIDAPLLRDEAYSTSALVHHGKRVIDEIGKIEGSLPAYLDIGSAEAWSSVSEIVFAKLTTLIGDRRMTLVTLDALERVRQWTQSPSVIETVGSQSRLSHGDLTAEQIFVTPDGYRVIDWQRPVIAPPDVDLVALLVGQNLDPRAYVDPIVIGVFWFLRLNWAVEAQFDLFPDKRWPLFDQWAAEAVNHILG